jgi:hypothetical protein
MYKDQNKNPIKDQWSKPSQGKVKEGLKYAQPIRTKKKGRKLVLFMVGSYFTHSPSNVASMQIVKSNNNGRSKTNITCQHNLFLYNKG